MFTKEILTAKVTDKRGSRDQYIEGLSDVVDLLKGSEVLLLVPQKLSVNCRKNKV